MDSLSFCSNWCSIFGFLITIGVMIKLYEINNRLLGKIRVPQILRNIEIVRTEIIKLLGQNPIMKETIMMELSKLEGEFESLLGKVDIFNDQEVKHLVARIDTNRKNVNRDDVFVLLADISKIHVRIKGICRDRSLEEKI